MSIRNRLTLWFTCLFGAIVVGVAIASYSALSHSLAAELDQELRVAVDATAMSAEHELNEHSTMELGEKDLEDVLAGRQQAALPDTEILVRQGDRQTAYRKSKQVTVDLRAFSSGKLQRKEVPSGIRVMTRNLPVPKFKVQYQIYAAASTAGIDRRLERFRSVLFLLVPLGLALAASGGYLLARKSLAPLDSFVQTIDSINPSDLGVRLALADNHDEVGRIGRRFNSLLERLQAAFDSQHRFMADASHELRTPVTVALAAVQVTSRDASRTAQECDEALRIVEQQMLRLRSIVQDLLFLSQTDAAGLKVDRKEMYLDDVVGDVSRAVQPLARAKEQQITVQALPEARICGDPDLLRQAMVILLDNAVKFTPVGGRICVALQRKSREWVCIISDTGIGIPEASQTRIFERFYQAEHTDAGAGSGSGLGLAIAKSILDSHSGSIVLAESRPGYTRFEMNLPAADADGPYTEGHQANPFAVKM
jgi:heavy metal sensor kinase